MDAVKSLLSRIIAWYNANAPAKLSTIPGPADEGKLSTIEQTLAIRLPEGYKETLRLHDGGIFIHRFELLDSSSVVDFWRERAALLDAGTFEVVEAIYADDGRIHNTWWHKGYVPIAQDSSGNLMLIDTAPGPNGELFQLVYFDTAEGPSRAKAGTFMNWLTTFADDLEAGKYRMDPGVGLTRE